MGDETQQQRQQQQSTGPGAGTPIKVDVYAEDDGNGNVSWSHEWRFENGGGGGQGTIEVPRKDKGQPGTPIQFHLRDKTRIGLSFASDPIWVDRIACPQSPASDPEITGINPQRNVLKLVDLNEDECVLHYSLRFDPDPDRYCYDPDIRNGGSTFA